MGGESIYGEKFRDENFLHKHTEPGLLSMANAGPNTNSSQFFITTVSCPHLNNKHVVFGKVVSGFEIVNKIEGLGKKSGEPSKKVEITNCGQLWSLKLSKFSKSSWESPWTSYTK